MRYAKAVLRVISPLWLVGVAWCCQEEWHDGSAANCYACLTIICATYVMFAACGFVGGWTGAKDIAFLYPILAILLAYLANPVASSMRWGISQFRFRLSDQFTVGDTLIMLSMVVLYFIGLRVAVTLLRRGNRLPIKAVQFVYIFTDWREWTSIRLLRTAYLLWLLAMTWVFLGSHSDAAWLLAATRTIILITPIMFAVSGWAAGVRRCRDISFVYPAAAIVVWFVVAPLSLAFDMHSAHESNFPLGDTFARIFVHQFDWKTGVLAGVLLLFYGAGFMSARMLLRHTTRPGAGPQDGPSGGPAAV